VRVESIPLMIHAKTGRDISSYLAKLTNYFERLGKNGVSIPGFELTKDEAAETVEQLHALVDNYSD
jgi:hypothetical protein